MQCLVCQKEFVGGNCPRCGYPVVEATDWEALWETMGPEIEEYRKTFQRGISLSLVIYRWKEADGVVVPDRKELLPFGPYSELVGKLTWLQQPFARIPDLPTLELQLQVSSGGKVLEYKVPIQNLMDAALQSVGIELTADLHFRLKLANELGRTTESQWMELL